MCNFSTTSQQCVEIVTDERHKHRAMPRMFSIERFKRAPCTRGRLRGLSWTRGTDIYTVFSNVARVPTETNMSNDGWNMKRLKAHRMEYSWVATPVSTIQHEVTDSPKAARCLEHPFLQVVYYTRCDVHECEMNRTRRSGGRGSEASAGLPSAVAHRSRSEMGKRR